jgi:hypothetical protein
MDFYVDFNIEVPNIGEEFAQEAEQHIRKLAADHSDIVGAAVSLENLVKDETSHLFQVRIVLYKRPEAVVVIQKDSEPMLTLRSTLEVLEKIVRASREKLAQVDSHQSEDIDRIYFELSADEVYATYAKNRKPADVVQKSRTEIASELMVEEGLTEEAAYFAADQILRVAQESTGDGEEE